MVWDIANADNIASKDKEKGTSTTSKDNHELSAQELQNIFQQAVNDDLQGRFVQARKGYDRLENTGLSTVSAVPSAINYVELNQLDKAKKAFNKISLSANQRDADYARLWQLWFIAHDERNNGKAQSRKLIEKVSGYQWQLPYEQKIADVYAGKGRIEDIYQVINVMDAAASSSKLDAITEATYFSGAYLRYIKRDGSSMLKLFDKYKDGMNKTSFERSLIEREYAEMKRTNGKLK